MGRGARVVAVMLAAAVLVGAAGAPVYVLPARDQPRQVDVVYVIGPPTDERMELAQQVIESGLSDTLLISIPDADGEYTAMLDTYDLAREACAGALDAEVICLQPEPFTTRGEAQALRDLAQEHGWGSASVITFTPHIARTRAIMERCYAGELSYLDPGGPIAPWVWAYHYAYQTAGFLKAAVEGPC